MPFGGDKEVNTSRWAGEGNAPNQHEQYDNVWKCCSEIHNLKQIKKFIIDLHLPWSDINTIFIVNLQLKSRKRLHVIKLN